MVFVFLLCKPVAAQVGINTDNSAPDNSAILDVKSTTKGLLPPRVALTSATVASPVSSPAAGLFVYNTATSGTSPNNVKPGYYCWNGSRWVAVIVPQGANAGDMLYWNGAQWVCVPAGSTGQVLSLNNGVPVWEQIPVPFISTVAVTNIGLSTATGGGSIISDGGSPLTSRGICWSINPSPTTADNQVAFGPEISTFSADMEGLRYSTHYYVRAFLTNGTGTYYGNQVSFTTLPMFTLGQSYQGGVIFYLDDTGHSGLIAATSDQNSGAPCTWGCLGLTMGTHTSIGTGQANTTAIINGCPIPDIAARICDQYSITVDGVTYDDWYLPSKNELNQMYFTGNLIGGFGTKTYWSSSEIYAVGVWGQYFGNGNMLNIPKDATTYYVRAIRSYSSTEPTLPTVTTNDVTDLTQNSLTSGGNVTSDGGSAVTARGICWSTSPDPTISDRHTTDGTGTETFTSHLSGLAANTFYYIRAYATNSMGTSYGWNVSFTTLPFAIGQPYQGGIIFYLDGTGQHGLIAAVSDQSTNIPWYNGTFKFTGSTGDGLYSGARNTAIIIASQMPDNQAGNFAAKICADYTVIDDGVIYGNWYLPSKYELDLLYKQQYYVGNFVSAVYWSSTEVTANTAWDQGFVSGTQWNDPKDYGWTPRVRAIRAF